jgi:hypothetical protein
MCFLVNRIAFVFLGQNFKPFSAAQFSACYSGFCIISYIVLIEIPVISSVPSSANPTLFIAELSYILRKLSKTRFHDIMAESTPP